MENRIGLLERALCAGTSPDTAQIASTADDIEVPAQSAPNQGLKHSRPTPQAALNLSCNPGAFPSSSLNNCIVNDRNESSSTGPDLVTRGLVSQHMLEKHVEFYHESLNSYIYHPLSSVDTVASLLKRSSLLLTAICAVAAFCAGSEDYETCMDIFINEVSATTFSHRHSFDDVRALCIGAFWLGKESSALNALGMMISQGLLQSESIDELDFKQQSAFPENSTFIGVSQRCRMWQKLATTVLVYIFLSISAIINFVSAMVDLR